VRDEQVPAGRQVALEHRDHALLHGIVEVDHDVAAENEIEDSIEAVDRDEVQRAILDEPPDLWTDARQPLLLARPRGLLACAAAPAAPFTRSIL
jgi:hypothetical protein